MSDGKYRVRKRKCLACGELFYTKETVYHPKRIESTSESIPVVLDVGAFAPERAHPSDAGLDLRSPNRVRVPARSMTVIDTGVSVAIPEGYVGLITSKSGLMLKGITCRGTIDSSYRGTIRAVIYNSSPYDYQFEEGDKITQLVIIPIITPEVTVVEELEDTDRGTSGFGSTGR
ncbi:MAG: dUTP diphosphatase [Clostridia bacterium]|nr:dUTP diphosphatase [Clostridia bacterium]